MTWNLLQSAWINAQTAWDYVAMAWANIPEPYKIIIVLTILGGSFVRMLYWIKARREKGMKELAKKWKEDPLNQIR